MIKSQKPIQKCSNEFQTNMYSVSYRQLPELEELCFSSLFWQVGIKPPSCPQKEWNNSHLTDLCAAGSLSKYKCLGNKFTYFMKLEFDFQ